MAATDRAAAATGLSRATRATGGRSVRRSPAAPARVVERVFIAADDRLGPRHGEGGEVAATCVAEFFGNLNLMAE